MAKIVKENLPITKEVLSRADALKLFKDAGQDYKVELIEDLPEDAVISLYRQGDFVDLCAGPHCAFDRRRQGLQTAYRCRRLLAR